MLGKTGKRTSIKVLRFLGAALFFIIASVCAVPYIPPHLPVSISLPNPAVVAISTLLGLLLLPDERGWRIAGYSVLAVIIFGSVSVISYGVASGFWEGVTWKAAW